MPLYNLEAVKAPRLCGVLLDLFSRLLRLPIIGAIILELIKKKNKVPQMVRFATRSHHCRPEGEHDGSLDNNGCEPQPLLPLYYPIHEMTKDEHMMHQRMAKEAPLNLKALAAADVVKAPSSNVLYF